MSGLSKPKPRPGNLGQKLVQSIEGKISPAYRKVIEVKPKKRSKILAWLWPFGKKG